jgi:hypothetical protein
MQAGVVNRAPQQIALARGSGITRQNASMATMPALQRIHAFLICGERHQIGTFEGIDIALALSLYDYWNRRRSGPRLL